MCIGVGAEHHEDETPQELVERFDIEMEQDPSNGLVVRSLVLSLIAWVQVQDLCKILDVNSLASGRMEGIEASPGAMAIFQRYIDGTMTMEEMGAAIDEFADREYGPVRLSRDERS